MIYPLEVPTEFLPGSSPQLTVTDALGAVRDQHSSSLHFERPWESTRGFQWDAPGARIRFRTNSARVVVHLVYTTRHIGPARNSIGYCRVGEELVQFTRPEPTEAGELPLEVDLSARSMEPKWREFEILLPYGDSVELAGITAEAGAQWEQPGARPRTRWIAFGDSVTQGFTGTDVLKTYAHLLGEHRGWQVLNAGIGGSGMRASDAAGLAGVEADLISVALGVNDWQGSTDLAVFRGELRLLLERMLTSHPYARLAVITPLWVPPAWLPATATRPLEAYREVIREVTLSLGRGIQLVEGARLIDHNAAYFDAIAVHPNDTGHAQMADRLADVLFEG